MDNSTTHQNNALQRVYKSKDTLLKERLRTLIKSKGMTESEFWHSVGMTKQTWYFYSWGIWEAPIALKVKIAQALNSDTCVIWQEQAK